MSKAHTDKFACTQLKTTLRVDFTNLTQNSRRRDTYTYSILLCTVEFIYVLNNVNRLLVSVTGEKHTR